MLELDLGEQVLEKIREASGERGESCPWRDLQDPFVQTVVSAHGHYEKGALGDIDQKPYALKRGIEIFTSALARIAAFDIKNLRPDSNDDGPPPSVRVRRESMPRSPRRR